MGKDEDTGAATSSGAQATAPSPGTGNWFALVEEFPNVKSVSDPPSPNMEDAPSEHSGVEGRLTHLEWEDKILLDQAIVTKQTMLKHAEHIRKLERTMRAICELILQARPKEEEARKVTGPAPEVGLLPPTDVIVCGEPFAMPPPAPQFLAQYCALAEQWQGQANPPTGMPPAPATLMTREPFPIRHPHPSSWHSLMPDIVTATNTISFTISIITSIITSIIKTTIVIIRWHPWVDTAMVDAGLNRGATVDPATRLHLGRACWEVPRCRHRDWARLYSGPRSEHKESTSP